MATEADLRNWKHEDFSPYLDIVVEAFGTERLMIGSDWPVCRLAGEYQDVTGIVEGYFSGMPDDLRRKVTGENCVSFYGLEI
jgi:L-fuconolactonase